MTWSPSIGFWARFREGLLMQMAMMVELLHGLRHGMQGMGFFRQEWTTMERIKDEKITCSGTASCGQEQQANFIRFLHSMLHVSSPDTVFAHEFLFFGGAAALSICGIWALPWRKAASSVKPRSRPLWKPTQLKNINLGLPQKEVIKSSNNMCSSCFQGWRKQGKPIA